MKTATERVRARAIYEARMMEAVAKLRAGLDGVGSLSDLRLSRTDEGRIYCRSLPIRDALRVIEETVPPPEPWSVQ